MKESVTEPYELQFASQDAWEDWLKQHYDFEPGVWLVLAKKGNPVTTVTYAEAVESALCFGWIDGMTKRRDEGFYVQKFTPRRKRSIWSKINVAKVEALVQAGRMRPAGLRAVEAAKADGRWDRAYDSPATIQMPDDFKSLLAEHPTAEAFYSTLNKTNQYAILWRITTATQPETRQKRMAALLQMLLDGKQLH